MFFFPCVWTKKTRALLLSVLLLCIARLAFCLRSRASHPAHWLGQRAKTMIFTGHFLPLALSRPVSILACVSCVPHLACVDHWLPRIAKPAAPRGVRHAGPAARDSGTCVLSWMRWYNSCTTSPRVRHSSRLCTVETNICVEGSRKNVRLAGLRAMISFYVKNGATPSIWLKTGRSPPRSASMGS